MGAYKGTLPSHFPKWDLIAMLKPDVDKGVTNTNAFKGVRHLRGKPGWALGASPTVAALGQVLLVGVSKDYWPRVTRHYSFSKEAVNSRFYIKSFEMLASTSFFFKCYTGHTKRSW